MEAYRQDQGHPWPVAEAQGTLLKDLSVLIQSSKLAFDARGVIIYRDGFYGGGEERWKQVFAELAASEQS